MQLPDQNDIISIARAANTVIPNYYEQKRNI